MTQAFLIRMEIQREKSRRFSICFNFTSRRRPRATFTFCGQSSQFQLFDIKWKALELKAKQGSLKSQQFSVDDIENEFLSTDFDLIRFHFNFRFCVGDKFYLCDNKILCEYDYEERLVFASMANHPILKRHAGGSLPGTPPNIPTSVSSPIQQNGQHHGLLPNISSPRSQNNDMNNNQNGLNGVSSPFGTPTHMKQVITTN